MSLKGKQMHILSSQWVAKVDFEIIFSVDIEEFWLWVDFKPWFNISIIVVWRVFVQWERIEFLYLLNFSNA